MFKTIISITFRSTILITFSLFVFSILGPRIFLFTFTKTLRKSHMRRCVLKVIYVRTTKFTLKKIYYCPE